MNLGGLINQADDRDAYYKASRRVERDNEKSEMLMVVMMVKTA